MANQSNPYNFLGELFPKQFRSVTSSIIWTLVFLIDTAIVFLVAHWLGIPMPIGGSYLRKGLFVAYLLAAFALFCLESFIYNRITSR